MKLLAACATLGVAFVLPVAAEAKGRYCGATENGLAVLASKTQCPFAKKVARRYLAVPAIELEDGVYGPPPRTLRVYNAKAKRKIKMRCRTVVKPNSPYMLCTGGKRRVEIRS